jgi:drug/metabolite transporter (DMT)-like permease
LNKGTLKADTLLLLTAAIWGFAFVAQRVGMEHIGPFLFNAIRFALGSLSLLPLIYLGMGNGRSESTPPIPISKGAKIAGSLLAGSVLFGGASLQQIGIVYTTAGKAGFITGLYVILVPIIGLKWGRKASTGTWIGALLAVTGLYLLSVTEKFTIDKGDFLVLMSAFMWAAHVLWISWLSPRMNPLILASSQFAICSIFSLLAACALEPIILGSILAAAAPILYGGLCSVGIAYTLQVVAQRDAHPAHASILLSVLGGWLMLNEILSMRGLLGCALMLSGMLLSQLWQFSRTSEKPPYLNSG